MTTEEIVQAMAESAHEAWMGWYAMRGITSRRAAWGEEFLVPFDQLSEDGKELDRIIMRAILTAFDRIGLKVVPK